MNYITSWFAKEDTKITILRPIPLKNNANLCYMNSMIQLLASSLNLISKLDNLKAKIKKPSFILNNFLDLLKNVNDQNSNVDTNSEKLTLLISSINWNKTSQQDAFNFLSVIINSIHKDIKEELSDQKIVMPLKSKFIHKISGINIKNKLQDHLGLSIGLFGDYTTFPGMELKYLIKEYFHPSQIDKDPSILAHKFFYKTAPDLLLLHIQANKMDYKTGQIIKAKYHIVYDENLLLEFDIAQDEETDMEKVVIEYKLLAVIHHMGTVSNGHYITYRRLGNKWFLTNDEQVEETQFNYDICPYILLYEKSETEFVKIDIPVNE